MTETLTPPVTGSPLAVLFDIVAAYARLTLEEERDGAETAAADHVYASYPDTLGAEWWTTTRGPATPPCATTAPSPAP